jgi:hypothetical protein
MIPIFDRGSIMNKTTLVFETTADIADFIARRRITNAQVDRTEVTVTALLNQRDIDFAASEYKARVVRMSRK